MEERQTRTEVVQVRQPKLIVFSGPPLSGKSALSKQLWRDGVGQRLEMDEIRKRITPASDHNKAHRDVAYRTMHRQADELFASREETVIVDATYAPREHRAGLHLLADKWNADVYLVECRVSPNDSAQRFRDDRPPGHAATDLTESRVRELAARFPYHGGGLALDTSRDSEAVCANEIKSYLAAERPLVTLTDWVCAGTVTSTGPEEPTAATNVEATPKRRISKWSRFQALTFLLGAGLAAVVTVSLFAIGAWALIAETPQSGRRTEEWFAAAGALIAFLAVVEYLRNQRIVEALTVCSAGSTPRFGPVKEVHRSNRELVADYLERTIGNAVLPTNQAMPIDGIPIWFVVPPEPDESFDVQCKIDEKHSWDEPEVARAAAGPEAIAPYLPFNWREYASWRKWEARRQSYGLFPGNKAKLRVTSISEISSIRQEPKDAEGERSRRVLHVGGAKTSHETYLITEQSAHLEVPGQIPYLREFLEGPSWSERRVDLSQRGFAKSHYSLAVGVQTIVTTNDGFVVLQRRSHHVQAAAGGMGCSGGGHIEWTDINWRARWLGNSQQSLRRGMYREMREELGLGSECFYTDKEPFIAAAFNLRYGRDLNFYAHLHCKLTRQELAKGFRGSLPRPGFYVARDRWEVGHLAFVHVNDILDRRHTGSDRIVFSTSLEELLGDGRHVRGALYAFAKSGRLSDVRDDPHSSGWL